MGVTANGWTWRDTGLANFTAPNGHVTSVANKSLAIVFAYLVYRWDTEIEPVTACYGNRTTAQQRQVNPAAMDSNHISATAIDVNGAKHPYEHTTRNWSSGFSTAGLAKLREILADTNVLQTGLDFSGGYRDAMHVQVRESASKRYSRVVSQAQVDAAAKRIGDRVLAMQKAVGATQDRIAGPGLKKAVLAFQKKHGLTQDGVWGPKSQAAAGGKTTPAPKPATKTTKFPLPAGQWFGPNDGTTKSHSGVRGGADKTNVTKIQKKAGATADGAYGSATKAKVASWQKAHKLSADGLVGPATWKAMAL